MKKLILTVMGILLLIAASSAQVSDKDPIPTDTSPDAHCKEYAAKMLYQATDLNLPLEEQQKRLNAAQAYQELATDGQTC